MNAVDSFLQKSQNDAQDFEENTRHDTVKTEENVEDDMEVDENVDNEEQYEPVPLPKDDCHNRTIIIILTAVCITRVIEYRPCVNTTIRTYMYKSLIV